MTQLTIPQIAGYWTSNGGNPTEVIEAVAVALAESGGRTDAVSPSSDYGLWQINSINFATFHLNNELAFDPNRNAQVAIVMSGNGTNWAAWCTCWVHPQGNCGHGLLQQPQVGSPAASHVPEVAAALGVGGTVQATPNAPDVLGGMRGAWANLQSLLGPWGRSMWGDLSAINTTIERLTQ